jgi:hypothetical protein
MNPSYLDRKSGSRDPEENWVSNWVRNRPSATMSGMNSVGARTTVGWVSR